MNLAMRATRPTGSPFTDKSVSPGTGAYYIATIRKTDTGNWGVRGKILHEDGSLKQMGDEKFFSTRSHAEKACRKLAKRKRAMRKYEDINLTELPEAALEHLEPDADNWVDPTDMVKMIEEAKKERYVWFRDITGIEAYFQIGWEYLAYITEDPDIYRVMDKYGEWRECMTARFAKIENTERTDEVMGMLGTTNI
jgi:hypothetical protein